MLLCYADESYTKDWYFMAALLCDGDGAQAITEALDEVIAHAVRDYGVASDAELHGYELFQGEGWWSGVPIRARIGVYNRAFEAIGTHCRAIILRGVNSAKWRRRYDTQEQPHSVVLMHLLERINTYASNNGEHALVIADEVGEQARHRADMASYRRDGTWGYRSAKLSQIVDTLHFAPSHASRLLQAIDLVVFLYRRMEIHTEAEAKAARANEQLWSHVAPKIYHRWCWHP